MNATIPNGETIYTGRNWSHKWSRDEWVVKDGMAYPVKRHNYWSSVQGKIEDISNETPMNIITTFQTWGARKIYQHEVEYNGVASFYKV